jgi:hypothetical protein
MIVNPPAKAIRGFFGEYRWLSNFAPCVITFEGQQYLSVEAAYQAAKTLDPVLRTRFTTLTPKEAKRLGRDVPLRPMWDLDKLPVMETLLRRKFIQEPYRSLLLQTKDAELVEENSWGDTFWGVFKGVGTNHLGRLLMKVRDTLQSIECGQFVPNEFWI